MTERRKCIKSRVKADGLTCCHVLFVFDVANSSCTAYSGMILMCVATLSLRPGLLLLQGILEPNGHVSISRHGGIGEGTTKARR